MVFMINIIFHIEKNILYLNVNQGGLLYAMSAFRISSYHIPIRIDGEPNKCIIIQGYTGAFDVISSELYSFLRATPSFCKEDFPFSKETFERLKHRGHITSLSKESEYNFAHKLAYLLHEKDKKLSKSFMFLISYDCNFRCSYCFENCISGSGHQWSKKAFTKKMVDKAYNAMLQIQEEKKLHLKTIMLYGGEPLLNENKGIVSYIVEQGLNKGYTFSAVTNGYDLNFFTELLSPDKINALQITIDGTKELHNQRRFHYKKGDSFDVIMDNIKLALQKGVQISVRINADKKTLKHIDDLVAEFETRGFITNTNFKYYITPLTNYEDNENQSNAEIEYTDRKGIQKQVKEKEYGFECSDYGTSTRILQAIKNKKPLSLRSTFCAAQSSEYIFDPYGNIYNCWNFVGQPSQIIGNYRNDKILWTSKKEDWHNRNISTSPNCKCCRYAFFCGGGCLARATQKNGKFDMSYCNNYPSMFKQAVNKAYSQYVK